MTTPASARPALTEDEARELTSAIDIAGQYVDYALCLSPIDSRAEELLDEARDRIHEALAAARLARATVSPAGEPT